MAQKQKPGLQKNDDGISTGWKSWNKDIRRHKKNGAVIEEIWIVNQKTIFKYGNDNGTIEPTIGLVAGKDREINIQ